MTQINPDPKAISMRATAEELSRYRLLFENMAEGFALHEIITDENGDTIDFRFLDVNACAGYLAHPPEKRGLSCYFTRIIFRKQRNNYEKRHRGERTEVSDS